MISLGTGALKSAEGSIALKVTMATMREPTTQETPLTKCFETRGTASRDAMGPPRTPDTQSTTVPSLTLKRHCGSPNAETVARKTA